MSQASYEYTAADPRAPERVPLVVWVLLSAAVLAVLSITISTVGSDGFGNLLRDGLASFPHWTT